ncbi:TPA: hypothetical protein ACGZ9Q_003426 [Elizabethkingia anophelis]
MSLMGSLGDTTTGLVGIPGRGPTGIVGITGIIGGNGLTGLGTVITTGGIVVHGGFPPPPIGGPSHATNFDKKLSFE